MFQNELWKRCFVHKMKVRNSLNAPNVNIHFLVFLCSLKVIFSVLFCFKHDSHSGVTLGHEKSRVQHDLMLVQVLFDKNFQVSLKIDKWLNPTWIPLRFNLH